MTMRFVPNLVASSTMPSIFLSKEPRSLWREVTLKPLFSIRPFQSLLPDEPTPIPAAFVSTLTIKEEGCTIKELISIESKPAALTLLRASSAFSSLLEALDSINNWTLFLIIIKPYLLAQRSLSNRDFPLGVSPYCFCPQQ